MFFIFPLKNSIVNIFDPEGLKSLIRLCLGFRHLKQHNFRLNFHNFLKHLCTSSLETDNTAHYLLHCHHNTAFNIDFTSSVKTFVVDFDPLSDILKFKPFYMKTLGAIMIKIILFYQLL